MKCLAIDDEPLALSQLVNYISQVPFLTLVKGCQDAFEAMQVMSEVEIDLIFTDINMPDLSGIDFVRSLNTRPLIIFTTAHPQYAVEGFKMEAIDYLLKPFDFQEFLKATDKARRQWNYRNTENVENVGQSSENSLFIQSDSKIYHIQMDDILYIEGRGEYVRIFTEDTFQPLITLLPISHLEEKLSGKTFMRVHNSYIINLRKITKVARLKNVLIGDKYIPIGGNYEKEFVNYIQERYIGK